MDSLSRKLCVVKDCVNIADPQTVPSLCSAHFIRLQTFGDLRIRRPCIVEGCVNLARKGKLCDAHAYRVKVHGSPLAHIPLRNLTRAGRPAYHEPTYNSWRSMIRRCENPAHDKYYAYGGRGIKVCPEWHDFKKFFGDMGERPPGMTLDRKDVNGDYEPGNCQWSTSSVQNHNKRSSRKDGLRGIHQVGDRYIPQISKLYTPIGIGSFTDIIEAAWMYDQLALALYGNDARLNFEYLPVEETHTD